MSTLTRADRAQRCDTIGSIAGWAAMVGCALLIAGLFANAGIFAERFSVLAPVGVLLLLPGGIVSMLADNLAGRYREPVDEDVDG